jgi:hypothetical protein
MHAWFKRSFGAATLVGGSGAGAGAALRRVGTGVTIFVDELLQEIMNGAETVAQRLARKKLRRVNWFEVASAGGQVLETEKRPLSFISADWGCWTHNASLSSDCGDCVLKILRRLPNF